MTLLTFCCRIDSKTGAITLKPKVPEMCFSIQVHVQNQTAVTPITTTVRITVVYISEDAVFNSGSIRINGKIKQHLSHKPVCYTIHNTKSGCLRGRMSASRSRGHGFDPCQGTFSWLFTWILSTGLIQEKNSRVTISFQLSSQLSFNKLV